MLSHLKMGHIWYWINLIFICKKLDNFVFLDAIASPSSYPCQWVSDGFKSDVIASPSFSSLLREKSFTSWNSFFFHFLLSGRYGHNNKYGFLNVQWTSWLKYDHPCYERWKICLDFQEFSSFFCSKEIEAKRQTCRIVGIFAFSENLEFLLSLLLQTFHLRLQCFAE